MAAVNTRTRLRSSYPDGHRTQDEPGTRSTPAPAVMLTADDVADMLACSTKTIYRLVDRGAIPCPIRLGGMLRWHRPRLEKWIADGCPSAPSSNCSAKTT